MRPRSTCRGRRCSPIEWIKYIDTAGVLQTLPPETYMVDVSSNEIGAHRARVEPLLAVHARYIDQRGRRSGSSPGYGDAAEDVPQAIRHGILIEIANLYENREDVVVGQAVNMMAGLGAAALALPGAGGRLTVPVTCPN